MSKTPSNHIAGASSGFLGQVRRHQRHNVTIFLWECLTSAFHWGFLETPVFPAYLLSVGASPMTTTTLYSGYMFAWCVPMVFFLPLVERHAGRARLMIRWGVGSRLVLPIIAVTAWATQYWGEPIGLAGVWVAIGILMLTAGPLYICWQDLNSRVVLSDVRGRYVAARLVIVTISFLVCGVVTWMMLGEVPAGGEASSVPPWRFAWPFAIGALVHTAALPLLYQFREPLPDESPPAWIGYRAGLWRVFRILKEDRRFLRYLWVRTLTCVIALFPIALVASYAKDKFGIPPKDIALWFTASYFIAMAVLAPAGGTIADRFGHKRLHVLSLVVFVAALLLALSLMWWPREAVFGGLLATLAVLGMAGGWYFASQFNLIFEFADVHRRSSYIAINGLFVGPGVLAAGLLGGGIVEIFGYATALIAAVVLTLIAAAVTMRYMPDPRLNVTPPRVLSGDHP